MTLDQEPIPREALPPGWGPAEHGDERIVYRHRDPPIELHAVQTEADRSHPALGLVRCWELRFRHTVGEHPITDRIGRVSTRDAAIDGLRKCMDRIHEDVDEPEHPADVQAALHTVPFDDPIPGEWSA